MPMQRDLYPEDWSAIATRIKDEVNWECEDCGKRCRRPGESSADYSICDDAAPDKRFLS
jgi:hypothetical protein